MQKPIIPRTLPLTTPYQAPVNSPLDYLAMGKQLTPIGTLFGVHNNASDCLNPGVKVVIQLLAINSMRFTEVINIVAGNELSPSMFIVHSAKGGANYAVHVPVSPYNRKMLEMMAPDERLFPFSYHKVWGNMKRCGLSLRIMGRVNLAVTHAGRYMLANKLKALNERDVCSDLLRHRNPKNKKYYLRDGPN